MCVTRINLGLMINAGMLLVLIRRLIFGGLMISLWLTGRSFVRCQVRAIGYVYSFFFKRTADVMGK